MRILKTTADLKTIKKGGVLTIGNFDGVHIGHQEILAAAKRSACQKKIELTAMTFEPHPVALLHPEKTPGILTPLNLKVNLLADLGVDCLVVLKDSRQLLNLSPQDFVSRFLVENIRPGVVVEGDDFNFGQGRTGNIDTLRKLGDENGFSVSAIPSKNIALSTGQTVRVSSTIIRYMLEGGHVADAALALGRPYRLIGKIISGRGKGKQLGFPTLNMEKPNQVIPAEGVYAGFVEIAQTENEIYPQKNKIPAVYSIGQARTFGTDFPLLIEAHLLQNKIGDIAGGWMAMDFIERIRSQHKFKTEKELIVQIADDCRTAKRILGT